MTAVHPTEDLPPQREWAVKRGQDAIVADDLPDETRAVQAEVRAFADRVLRPAAHELNCEPERRDGFRHDVFAEMAAAGLFAIPFAADVGGRGLAQPMLATLIAVEELGYYSPGIASSMFDAHAILVGGTLDAAGGDVRARYLPRLIRGDFVGSFATSEPAASTDLSVSSIQSRASAVSGGWAVSGRKRWITNAPVAGLMVTLCRTGDTLSMLAIDMASKGITVADPDRKMGNHAQLTADVTFDEVFVPSDHVLGVAGSGLRVALGSLALGRMGIGAVGVAMAQRAMDVAVDYMGRRKVYGRLLNSFQYWQMRFAEHAIEIEAARSLFRKASQAVDRGGDASILAAMAKAKGSALAVDVARDAIQVCGGYGFARHLTGADEYWPLEAIYRDAKIGEIYEGANEVQKWIIARRIFGRAATG